MDDFYVQVFNFFLTVQICKKERVIATLSEIAKNTFDYGNCLKSVNSFIKKYDLEIVDGKSEVTGEEYTALVQVCENTIAQYAKSQDKKVSAYFSKLLTNILLSGCGHISDTEALNLCSDVDMTKSVAQNAVQDLISNKWLEEKDEAIFIGPRSILELGQLLTSNYPNDSKQCPLCLRTLFFGNACKSCQSIIHLHCLKKYWEQSNTCPSCKESTAVCFDDISDVSQIHTPCPSKAKRRRKISE